MGFDLSVLLTAFLAALFLAGVVRWVFRPSRPRTGLPQRGPGADLGSLVPVLVATPRAQAIRSKDTLSRGGIRCSMSRISADSYDVLVFRDDLDGAQRILAES